MGKSSTMRSTFNCFKCVSFSWKIMLVVENIKWCSASDGEKIIQNMETDL